MKFTLSIAFALLSVGLASAAAVPTDLESRGGIFPVCSPVRCLLSVPFLRAYNPQIVNHFYTTNSREMNNAVRNSGYTAEGTAGFIFSNQQPQTTPLFRLYSASATDHFYMTDLGEKNNAIRSSGYADEGTAGFVYTTAICGSVPLYRLFSAEGKDHFYTTSTSERDSAAGTGYSVEGIAGYVFTSRI
ncbi:hypothetical protein Hypma_003491 [Hypsizygus marmoreus]|uniref:DUF5648 domain-containing protein n=1 Tax=Hypsizygus marmoreus TaxID=39966 RepID=A0A369J228_HYPMA|nr:hypothetical protein Hypma_003491 [Hypsizygus marmoreus]